MDPQPTNHAELIDIALGAWEELKQANNNQTLADSIKRCIAVVKAAKGYPTKY